MIEFTITTDAHKLVPVFNKEAQLAPTKAAAITQRNANRMLSMVRVLSPFRTGEYRASHQISLTSTGQTYSGEIYTDLARGRMLEFGGQQLMSDGSTVERRPKPHYRPAFEFVSAQYYEELSKFVTL